MQTVMTPHWQLPAEGNLGCKNKESWREQRSEGSGVEDTQAHEETQQPKRAAELQEQCETRECAMERESQSDK